MSDEGWRCSLHGGHSGEFCDHATGTLREVVQAAVAAGYRTFGLSEHAPRTEGRWLYPTERSLGWDVAQLTRLFADYARASRRLQREFASRLCLLRGFECEVVPDDTWLAWARGWRRLYGFQYVVGSVHFVGEQQIDGSAEGFAAACASAGGVEPLVVAYYHAVAELATRLRPEVMGHLDLVRRFGEAAGLPDTPRTRAAELRALHAIARSGAVLDLNLAGWRKGLAWPYPEPRLVRAAHELGIPFCLGDDSHGPDTVGVGLDEGRRYLLSLGVTQVCVLAPVDDPAGPVERVLHPL